MNQVSRFSAGTLLYRVAQACGNEPALVGVEGTISHRELARLAVATLEIATKETAHALIDIGPMLSMHTIVASYAALLSPYTLRGCPGHSDHQRLPWLDCAGHAFRTAGWKADLPGKVIASRTFDAAAMQYPVSASENVAWTHEALCYGWGVASPAPGSISVMAGPVWDPINWSALFGALIGRGRVILPGAFGTTAWMDSVIDGGATEIHLRANQLDTLPGPAARLATTVANVCVWTRRPVALDRLSALRGWFPNASITRILEGPGGPITLATLDELRTHGAAWAGVPVLGTRLSISPEGELHLAECAFGAHRVISPASTDAEPQLWRETGIWIGSTAGQVHKLRDPPEPNMGNSMQHEPTQMRGQPSDISRKQHHD